MLKWIVIGLATAGVGLAAWTAATADVKLPKTPPARPPSVNPYSAGLAATGLVEACSRNIQVAAPEQGLVVSVAVQVGDTVRAGDELFRLDGRAIEAELLRGESALGLSRARLAQLEAMPRAEELPPLAAAAEGAAAALRDAESLLAWARRASASQAATESEIERRDFAVQAARALRDEAASRLALARAGAWAPDLEVARAAVRSAESDIAAWRIRLERLTVRAPIDGAVLKREIEPGEFTSPGGAEAPMVIGDIRRLRVRAQVNEEDAPLLRDGAGSVARVRGGLRLELPLRMVRIEPLARAKRQLTGAASELVDTRVVEALFDADVSALPAGSSVFPGQLVDVFIETAPAR